MSDQLKRMNCGCQGTSRGTTPSGEPTHTIWATPIPSISPHFVRSPIAAGENISPHFPGASSLPPISSAILAAFAFAFAGRQSTVAALRAPMRVLKTPWIRSSRIIASTRRDAWKKYPWSSMPSAPSTSGTLSQSEFETTGRLRKTLFRGADTAPPGSGPCGVAQESAPTSGAGQACVAWRTSPPHRRA